jgi:hypothetical protein
LKIQKDYISEADLLEQIFHQLTDLDQLYKLSILQYNCDKAEDALEWLIKRRGKFYFNIDINDDEDTKMWHDFKVKYIKTHL